MMSDSFQISLPRFCQNLLSEMENVIPRACLIDISFGNVPLTLLFYKKKQKKNAYMHKNCFVSPT